MEWIRRVSQNCRRELILSRRPDAMNGFGMWNVNQRIKLCYGETCGIEVESEENRGDEGDAESVKILVICYCSHHLHPAEKRRSASSNIEWAQKEQMFFCAYTFISPVL